MRVPLLEYPMPLPDGARRYVERCAAWRAFDVAVLYGIHLYESFVADLVLEAGEPESILALLELCELFAGEIESATAIAWAELHRPDGVP